MPRPRKPTNVLELAGAFKAHPARRQARENEPPIVGEVGEPPDHLLPEVAAAWREIVGLAHPGTLGRADRLLVEHGSHLLAQLRASNWTLPAALLLRWEGFLSRLGLTPTDRSRVSALKRPAVFDPIDEFLK